MPRWPISDDAAPDPAVTRTLRIGTGAGQTGAGRPWLVRTGPTTIRE